jgi:alkanesulfonate monooxygenase SsuD/methylene tetrahydromethanopterin reductase-like flavin-dependent oxidoreductase (luciferase family)
MTRAGLLLPSREAAIGGHWDARGLVRLARHAEDLGFDSVWAGDSLTARPRFEPLALLAAVAAATESVTVGTAALIAPLRHPLLAAHAIATVDRLAAGRLVLGLGAGFPAPATEAEFTAAGVPFAQRHGRLLETVRLWRALWGAAPADRFTGEHWQLTGIGGLPGPARPGGPPLWLAGAGPRALREAGRSFDGWLPYPPSAAEYRVGREAIAFAARESGRDPAGVTGALYATVLPAASPDRARELLDAYARACYGVPLDVVGKVQLFVGGPLDHIESVLRRYGGVEHVVLRVGALATADHLAATAELAQRVRRWT